MLTLGPQGVLLIIGSTRSDGSRFSTEGEPQLQSGRPLTEAEVLSKSGNVE